MHLVPYFPQGHTARNTHSTDPTAQIDTGVHVPLQVHGRICPSLSKQGATQGSKNRERERESALADGEGRDTGVDQVTGVYAPQSLPAACRNNLTRGYIYSTKLSTGDLE